MNNQRKELSIIKGNVKINSNKWINIIYYISLFITLVYLYIKSKKKLK